MEFIGRLLVIGCALGLSFWMAFKETPELDEVQNRGLYRLCYAVFVWRGLIFLAETLKLISRID